jgi:outer membrane protein assembly factor BamB
MRSPTVRLAVVVAVSILSGSAAAQETPQKVPPPSAEKAKSRATVKVSGVVFDDRNADGVRQEGEAGLAGVWVSNGLDVRRTDAAGRYGFELPLDRSRCVFVVVPGDRRLHGRWYVRVPPSATADVTADFGLAPRPPVAAAPVPPAMPTLRFAQVTDIHVSTAQQGRDVAADIAEINALPVSPDFIVSTGDLINKGTAEEFAHYLAGMSAARMPVRHLIGNHDCDGGKASGATLLYEEHCGPPYYAFEAGHVHFVCLDSMHWNGTQRDWLKWYLGTVPEGRTIVVFQHYPPTRELLDYLAGFPVKGIFSGHVHGIRIAEHRGIFNCNSTTLRMGAIDRSPRGFQDVTVAGDVVRCRPMVGGAKTQFFPPKSSPVSAGEGEKPDLAAAADPTGPSKPLAVAWSADSGGLLHAGGAVLDAKAGRVYVGTLFHGGFDGCGVTCLDAATGRRLWRTLTDSCVKNSPAVGPDGRVYAVSLLGTVYCLDGADGRAVWKQTLGDPAVRWEISSPTVADGAVYVGVGDHLAALSAATGEFLWKDRFVAAPPTLPKRPAPVLGERPVVTYDDWWPSCYASAVVAGDLLYLGGRGGLHAVDRKTGLLKSTRRPEDRKSYPVVPALGADGRVYAAMGRLVAVPADDPLASPVMRSEAATGDVTARPAVSAAEGLAVFVTQAGEVIACSTADGKTRWTHKTGEALADMIPYRRGGASVTGSPVIAGGVVLVGGDDGVLYALDLKTGRELHRLSLGVPLCGTPAVAGNAVFVAGQDGRVYALTLKAVR